MKQTHRKVLVLATHVVVGARYRVLVLVAGVRVTVTTVLDTPLYTVTGGSVLLAVVVISTCESSVSEMTGGVSMD